jgi:hypothetical protein
VRGATLPPYTSALTHGFCSWGRRVAGRSGLLGRSGGLAGAFPVVGQQLRCRR